jgi:hypothetical protein
LTPGELVEARVYLSEAAWLLFEAMPRGDQRHSLKVLQALRAGGHDHPALLQAALLHDCAKGGVRLSHRVATVLIKAFRPALLARWTTGPAPNANSWHYPFWAHLNHPARGADLAAAAGCDPLAVTLIRRHQERPVTSGDSAVAELLVALQAADDDS